MRDLTEAEGIARARERMKRTGRPLGVAVRRWWVDRRPAPLGDGWSAKVVISDGSMDYTPQTQVYVWRAMRSPEEFADELENELELLAARWPTHAQAGELALAVQQDRLVMLLEDFGLGRDRREPRAATALA